MTRYKNCNWAQINLSSALIAFKHCSSLTLDQALFNYWLLNTKSLQCGWKNKNRASFLELVAQGITPFFKFTYYSASRSPAAPCPFALSPSLRLQTQREETAKCVSWKGGEVEKAHPAPRITDAPPEPLPLAFLQRQQKFPERGAPANSNRARSPLCRPVSRPCGPALGFLRARCSWSTLNKGNSNVTATVNLLGCSCQQDVPNQSRNNPT